MNTSNIRFIKKIAPLFLAALLVLASCKKTVEWNISLTIKTEAREINLRSAQLVGLISVNRGGNIKQMGFCWNTAGSPTVDDNVIVVPEFSDTSSVEYFDYLLEELTTGTTYYVKAFAENNDGVGYGNEVSFRTKSLDDIKIGSPLQGGFIFFVDSTGEHGLICAPTDIDFTDWGCAPDIATSSKVGSGLSNSIAIDKECPTSAATKCLLYKDIEGEWYLPSIDEWQLIYDNLVLGDFWSPRGKVDYWSSSQDQSNSAFAMSFYSFRAASPASQRKYLGGYVLPIKEF